MYDGSDYINNSFNLVNVDAYSKLFLEKGERR